MCWIDPASEVICILFASRSLMSGWATSPPRFAAFSDAVIERIVD
jgi:hypothetical protein